MSREIKDEEIIILIVKYLRDNGYTKTLKSFQKETTKLDIHYEEMDSIRDLKWVLNDYFRLRSEEIGKQELSHSLSLSFGPEIERMYKQLETMLSDYSQYRKIIENQLHRINETYDLPGNPPLQEQSFQQPELGDEFSQEVPINDVDLPMEQYLHLYRTLPNILPDMINQSLSRNQTIDDEAIDTILNSLQENAALGEIIPSVQEQAQSSLPIGRRTQRKTTPKRKSPDESLSKRQHPRDASV